MDSNGHCSSPIPNIPSSATGCSAYCEVKLTKILGQEIPFEEGSCQGGTTCAVASGRSVSITNTYGVNTNVGGSVSGDIGNDISGILKSVINVGASYSYSQTIGYSTIILNSKDLNDTTCGYWTFIPYFIKSVSLSFISSPC